MLQATAPAISNEAYSAATPGFSSLQYQSAFQNKPRVPNNYEGNDMGYSLRTNPIFNRGEHSANRHLTTDTRECSDWLQDQFRQQSAAAISKKTGQGQRAAEAVKMGRNGLTMAHLVNICRADPDFRAQFFSFCGGKLEGHPEMVAALSRAINAVINRNP